MRGKPSATFRTALRRVALAGAGAGAMVASLLAFVAGPSAGVAAAASPDGAPLPSAFGDGIFAGGGLTLESTEIHLPVAVGGNAFLQNARVDSDAKPANQHRSSPHNRNPALVVGGTLTVKQGNRANGTVFVGKPPIVHDHLGTLTYNSPLLTTDPVDVAGQLADLQSLSSSLASQPTTGRTRIVAPSSSRRSHNGDTLTLVGAPRAALDVFNLTGATGGADLRNAKHIRITGIAKGATVVINTDVTGLDAAARLQSVSGTSSATHVLWNFADAATITLPRSGWYGTILAPEATVIDGPHSSIHGSILAGGNVGSWTHPWTADIANDAFTGRLPVATPPAATPEGFPAALGSSAVVIVGGAMWWVRRRRRNSPSTAA